MEILILGARCNHPHIAQYFGGFFEDGCVNLVLEYMDAGSIAQCLAARGPMPEDVIGKMAAVLLPALIYVHKELHIVHRDIKPANILINR
jgi:serine/threonine protein kinase